MSRFLRQAAYPRTTEDFAEAYQKLAWLHGLSFDELKELRGKCVEELLGGQSSEVTNPLVIFMTLEFWLEEKDRDER